MISQQLGGTNSKSELLLNVSMRFRFREKNFNSIGSGTVYSFAVQIAIEKASRNAGVCT